MVYLWCISSGCSVLMVGPILWIQTYCFHHDHKLVSSELLRTYCLCSQGTSGLGEFCRFGALPMGLAELGP